jgi:TM2 domain-containing membrane protein YozV
MTNPMSGDVNSATGISDKSKVVAGVLQILLGAFGAGRFYTGHTGKAIAQIAVTWVLCGAGAVWPLIDGILILVKGGTDAQGRPLRD